MSFESSQHSGSFLLSGLRCSGTGDVISTILIATLQRMKLVVALPPLYTQPRQVSCSLCLHFLWLAKLAAYCSFMFNAAAWIRVSFLGK